MIAKDYSVTPTAINIPYEIKVRLIDIISPRRVAFYYCYSYWCAMHHDDA
ncbi:MAG: hypothetical protein OR997_06890 [Methylophilaceae bacterium]|nr:hypothetical protein [Methylophilaceae bacterium]